MIIRSRRAAWLLLPPIALLLAACAGRPQGSAGPARPHAGPYADGREHVETVRYNGRDYRVAMRRLPASDVFALTVSAPGRALGGTPGDLRIVRQAALSTLRHYACREGRRAEAVPGSAAHADGRWQLRARCL